MSSPTSRSLEKMRKAGFLAEVVERWNQWARVRHDLFGFIDVLALRGNELWAIQTTSGSNVSARIKKIRETPSSAQWLSSPTRRIIVHGWARRGAKGKRKLWACREIEVLVDGEVELTWL